MQQYIVDAYAAIEQNRLNYLRRNQKTLRVDLYQGLQDALEAGDTNTTTLGTRIVLPSSFTGGPRFMVQLYQDAMAICRSFGLSSYFITFTCKPNWPEIQAELIPGQTATDCPDLVTRVFRMKLSVLMKDEVFWTDRGIDSRHRVSETGIATRAHLDHLEARVPTDHSCPD